MKFLLDKIQNCDGTFCEQTAEALLGLVFLATIFISIAQL